MPRLPFKPIATLSTHLDSSRWQLSWFYLGPHPSWWVPRKYWPSCCKWHGNKIYLGEIMHCEIAWLSQLFDKGIGANHFILIGLFSAVFLMGFRQRCPSLEFPHKIWLLRCECQILVATCQCHRRGYNIASLFPRVIGFRTIQCLLWNLSRFAQSLMTRIWETC